MKGPKVSIILPVYNGARFIENAIGSVREQSFTNWELLVIDDGSTDGTANIAGSHATGDERIRSIKNNENLGIQKTLNRGLREAQGHYIARIDDDDRWIDTDKLKKQVAFLDAHAQYVIIGTGVVVFDEDGKELFRFLNPETNEAIRRSILVKNCFTHSSVLFRREAALQFNGYSEDEEAKHLEDYDLWLKFGRIGKMANLPICATGFTLRPGNISSEHKIEQFKKGQALAKKYRSNYPRQTQSLARNRVRVALYAIYGILPRSLQRTIFKIYKERY